MLPVDAVLLVEAVLPVGATHDGRDSAVLIIYAVQREQNSANQYLIITFGAVIYNDPICF